MPREERTRAIGWDPISGLHQGQRPERPHLKAVYMAAPERFAEMSDFSLAPRASSIHGTLRQIMRCNTMAAIGVIADIKFIYQCTREAFAVMSLALSRAHIS